MELLQLKYFCSAAKTENFSRTARQFLVPPSDISQSIQRLEKELGTKLFARTSNSVTLNEQGRRFYADVSRALSLLESAEHRLRETEEVGGEVRLLVRTNRRYIANSIEIFQKKHKNIQFSMMHSRREGDSAPYDLVVDEDNGSQAGEKQLLVREKIGLAMGRDDPRAGAEPFRLADFRDAPFITMHEDSSHFRTTCRLCREAGFEPDIAIRTDDPFYVRKCVELGLGVAVTPMTSWEGQYADTVVCREIPGALRDTCIFWDGSRYLPKAARLFLESLPVVDP